MIPQEPRPRPHRHGAVTLPTRQLMALTTPLTQTARTKHALTRPTMTKLALTKLALLAPSKISLLSAVA